MRRGRREAAAIRDYLDLLARLGPIADVERRRERVALRLAAIERALPWADTVATVHLVQERRALLLERRALEGRGGLAALESAFVRYAAAYGARRGIDYDAWRARGVPAAVLRRAGIRRAR